MIKNVPSILLLFALAGCASINVPNYVKDENPYKRLYYAPFAKVKDATERVLRNSGWVISQESDPALFELERSVGEGSGQQTLIFTEIRQFSFFFGSRYARLNAFLRSLPDGATEVEIRYLAITATFLKKFYRYKNDKTVKSMFSQIEKAL